jgi:signal transduction histidine kinase
VAAAVRASRGRLEISSGPGPGTTVRLLLPARQFPVRHA